MYDLHSELFFVRTVRHWSSQVYPTLIPFFFSMKAFRLHKILTSSKMCTHFSCWSVFVGLICRPLHTTYKDRWKVLIFTKNLIIPEIPHSQVFVKPGEVSLQHLYLYLKSLLITVLLIWKFIWIKIERLLCSQAIDRFFTWFLKFTFN